MLQDTHFSKEKEPFVRSLWGGECIFNNNNSQSCGVATLFSNNFSYKVHKYYGETNGNLLIIDIKIRDFRFTLVNVPNRKEVFYLTMHSTHLVTVIWRRTYGKGPFR